MDPEPTPVPDPTTTTPVTTKPPFDANDVIRGLVTLVALGGVVALAFIAAPPIAQQMATALTVVLAGAVGYLFRGRVQTTDSATPVVTPLRDVRRV